MSKLHFLLASLASVAHGNAYLSEPTARTSTKWDSNARLYSYSTYTRPTNGITDCAAGSTNAMCSVLDSCDGTSTSSSRTQETEGGIMTVEWTCVSNHTLADDQSSSSGVTIAIRCGSSTSFFNKVLSSRFDANCNNITFDGDLQSNALVLNDSSITGDCTVLWAWELTQASGGFYMGCSDITVGPESGGDFRTGSGKSDYDTSSAAAGVILPMLVIFITSFVLYQFYYEKLPQSMPYIRFGILFFVSLVAFSTSAASNDFVADNDFVPFGGSAGRGLVALGIIIWVYSIALALCKYEEFDVLDSSFSRFAFDVCVIISLFVTAALVASKWEGKDEYCTYESADTQACNTYKMGIVGAWMTFSLLVVHAMYCFIEIWAEAHLEAEERASKTPKPPPIAELKKLRESQAALAASMEQSEEDAADAKTGASLEGEATVV